MGQQRHKNAVDVSADEKPITIAAPVAKDIALANDAPPLAVEEEIVSPAVTEEVTAASQPSKSAKKRKGKSQESSSVEEPFAEVEGAVVEPQVDDSAALTIKEEMVVEVAQEAQVAAVLEVPMNGFASVDEEAAACMASDEAIVAVVTK